MTDDDLNQLLRARLQQQSIEPEDLPLFLRDLAAIVKSKPDSDVAALNERLSVLGWHQAKLDYHSLQLVLAWVEAEARNTKHD